jgi:hypothetical protein
MNLDKSEIDRGSSRKHCFGQPYKLTNSKFVSLFGIWLSVVVAKDFTHAASRLSPHARGANVPRRISGAILSAHPEIGRLGRRGQAATDPVVARLVLADHERTTNREGRSSGQTDTPTTPHQKASEQQL